MPWKDGQWIWLLGVSDCGGHSLEHGQCPFGVELYRLDGVSEMGKDVAVSHSPAQ